MKIGILTYHRVINDGSVIQAYCLQKILQKQYPRAIVEIIDYRPLRGEIKRFRGFISRQFPFFQMQYYKKLCRIDNFVCHQFRLSSQSCTTDNIDKARMFIHRQEYDAIIIGSDTVWEARPSAVAPPAPNIYYLPKLPVIKKIAFAASADPVLPDFPFNKHDSNEIYQAIDDFDFISVRDAATKKYLIRIGVNSGKIHFMPDPTILYDFSPLIDKPKGHHKKKKPIAGISICVGDQLVRDQIAAQLQQDGYDVVFLANSTQLQRYFGYPIQTVGHRLGVHSVLDILVTDRFHSSIFALVLAQAPVIFVEAALKWAEPNSKGRDLFCRLGIEKMVWRYDGIVPEGLIEEKLEIWNNVSIGIKDHLSSLMQLGRKYIESERFDLVDNVWDINLQSH
jgi:polysaccharide pyruvyl transferase WcaK-like protein